MYGLTGTVQNILSKATKYAFFDPTKEMAYIPLDQEAKVPRQASSYSHLHMPGTLPFL